MLATALTGSLALAPSLTTPARAQSLTWDTTSGDSTVIGGSGTWDVSAQTWTANAGTTNQAWEPGAEAIFSGTAGTVTVDGAQTVGGLSFNSNGYTLTGDTITLTAGGNEINVATGTATVDLRLSDGAGYVGMRKTGSGTLVLSETTSIYGMVTVEEGTLSIGINNPLNGSGDGVTVNSGATLDVANSLRVDEFAGSGNTVIAAGQTLTIGVNSNPGSDPYSGVISGGGNFNIMFAKTLSGDNTFTGKLTVEFGRTTVTGSLATEDIVIEEDLTWGIGDLNVAGDGDAISDTAVIDNRGILTLTGNDETIGAVFGAGDINLKNNTLTTGDAANREISGVISGTGGLAKQGSGTLTLSGTNTATGTLTNNAGTVVAGSWAGDVTNNATFDLTGTSTVGGTFTNNAAGSVTNSGGGAVQLTGLTNFIGNGSIGSAAGSITVNTQNLTYRDGHSETGTVTFNVSDTITEERTAGPTWSGTGHTTNFATAAAGVFTTGGDFTTTGTLTHASSAALTVSAGDTLRASAVTNASGSTINVQTGASLVGTGNTANNSGTVNVAGGGSLVELTGDYNNLAGGIVNFNDAGAKTFDVQAGVITNAGTLNFNAGTTAVNSVGGAFQNSGTGDINIANGATLNAAGDTITNAGTIDMLGSSSVLTADTLTNNTGGVVNAQGTLTGAVTNQGGGDFNITGDLTGVTAFTNTGTATFDIGSGTTSTIGSLTNTTTGGSGTTVASSATLNVTGTIENGLASGAAASVITNNWTLTGDTIVNHAGATLNSNTATSHLDATGGSLTNNGTMNVRGQLDAATTINNGSSAVFNVTGATARSGVAAFVNENGAILNISGGALDRTSLNNTSGGSGSTLATAGVQIEAGGELTAATVSNSGSGTLYNAGTITGNVTNSATAHSTGTITGDVVNTGAMQLEGILTGSLTNSGTGTVTITGNLTGVTTLTQNGTGPLTVSGGATLTNSSGIVGGLGGSNGTVTVTGTGSTWTNSSGLTVGDAGAGALTLSAGGTVNASGTVTLASQAGSTGTLNIGSASGDTAIAAGIFAPEAIAFGAGDGEIVFNHTDTNYTFDADISGDGSISVLSGTTKLTGTNSYTGGTTVSAGTLQVGDGGTSGSFSGDVTNNSALIFNRSDAMSYGGEISGTGSLTKSGAGTLTLTGTNTHTGGTTVTAGTLQVGDGGTSGSFSGDVTNNGALIFNRSDALSYGGEISGTGSLTKSGAGTLTLTGTNTHTGGTTVTAGTLQVGDGGTSGSFSGDVTNNSALIFNRSDALSYGGEISGTGSLTKSGAGTLTLIGTNSYTGGTTVWSGVLTVNGSTGDITLNGGTLGGSGTVGSVTAKSGSTIAPGNSIGILNVSGNTSFASGSTYAVEVDKNGNSDRIVATGTVTIDSGATVSVSPENGTDDGSTYSVATTYTMLTANTGVTGTFGSVTDTFAFLDASLSYDANNVYLKLFRNDFLFTTFARTPNQRATAGALDTLGSGNAVYDAVSVLGETDARAAFDSLSGEVQASVNTLMIQQSSLARDAVGDRIRTAFDSIASGEMQMIAFNGEGEAPAVPGDVTYAWGQAYGNWGRSKGDGNAGTMDHVSGGFFMGVDASLFDSWRGGVIAGYGNTSFDVDARASSGSADSYTLGAYAGNQLNALGLRAGASYSWHDVSTSRSVTAGTLHNTLSADYSAATAQLFGEAGFTVNTQIARFEPFAGAALIHQRNDSFTETGGAAALSVAAASQTLGITSLGLRTERQVDAGDTFTATLTGSLAWQHAFGDRDATSIMRFDSGGDPFEITGLPLDSDTVLIQAGIDLDFGQNINLTAGYNGDLGINAQNHAFSARMAARF